MSLRKNPLVSSLALSRQTLERSFSEEFSVVKDHCHLCSKHFSLTRKRRVCSACGQPVCKADSFGAHSTCICSKCRSSLLHKRAAMVAKPLLDKRYAKLDEMLVSQSKAQHKIASLKESTRITESLHASASEQFHTKLVQSSQALDEVKEETKSLEEELAQLQQELTLLTQAQSQRETEVTELEIVRSDLNVEVQDSLRSIDSLEASRKDLLTKLISVLQYKELKGLLCSRCWGRVQSRGNKLIHRYTPMGTCLEAKVCSSCCIF